ncbi:hypothetical protein [Streptomyces sp. H27-H5]|uniref:hypothetical protein n=1 Tax=Streptomyces sp. H27-H5 TaxID=2996460 RepID=UPI00226D47D1|nr:hypothetical protein [Streptomyces sp. H27-H5]MCY0961734.1 hypothetical protein [Streptomyces sp. H27-H5]
MLRRIVAGVAAVVLVAEAALLVLVHVVLGKTTANQSMSIAGMDPNVMSKATYVMGAGIGAFLLVCAVLLGIVAVRDRAPGRFARIVLVIAAVTHVVLGALAVALIGWSAFAATMLILCLIVLVLTLPAPGDAASAAGPRDTLPRDVPPPPPHAELKPTNP